MLPTTVPRIFNLRTNIGTSFNLYSFFYNEKFNTSPTTTLTFSIKDVPNTVTRDYFLNVLSLDGFDLEAAGATLTVNGNLGTSNYIALTDASIPDSNAIYVDDTSCKIQEGYNTVTLTTTTPINVSRLLFNVYYNVDVNRPIIAKYGANTITYIPNRLIYFTEYTISAPTTTLTFTIKNKPVGDYYLQIESYDTNLIDFLTNTSTIELNGGTPIPRFSTGTRFFTQNDKYVMFIGEISDNLLTGGTNTITLTTTDSIVGKINLCMYKITS
jgi:hypothetical protein